MYMRACFESGFENPWHMPPFIHLLTSSTTSYRKEWKVNAFLWSKRFCKKPCARALWRYHPQNSPFFLKTTFKHRSCRKILYLSRPSLSCPIWFSNKQVDVVTSYGSMPCGNGNQTESHISDVPYSKYSFGTRSLRSVR